MLVSEKKNYSENSNKMAVSCHMSTQQEHNLPSNSREMRNRAEKMRRDKLNSYIGELATLVPMVAKSSKRMDKTSILRLTATHLRIYQTLLSGRNSINNVEMPKFVDQCMLEQIVCNELGGFMLILTMSGKIIFVSSTVENLLGYIQTDLMGQSIYNITLPSDHEKLKTYLNSSGDLGTNWRKYFNISMRRAGPRAEVPVYETVRVMSIHRPSTGDDSNPNSPTTTTMNNDIATINNGNNDILVLFIRVKRPEPMSRLLDASKNEYVTRHLVDGRIVNCDHRISLVAGYMTDEVSGLSAFKFMHKDDVRWVIIALRQMYDRGETKGSSCYRLLSRNSKFIYLKTSGFLEVDNQGTVESFICINTLVDENEGKQLIEEMKRKYSAYVNSSYMIVSSSTNQGVESVEDPRQIEQAVMNLIRNLPSSSGSIDVCSKSTTSSTPKLYYEKKDCETIKSTDTHTKTAIKRPPSTDLLDANVIFKRHKTTRFSLKEELSIVKCEIKETESIHHELN